MKYLQIAQKTIASLLLVPEMPYLQGQKPTFALIHNPRYTVKTSAKYGNPVFSGWWEFAAGIREIR